MNQNRPPSPPAQLRVGTSGYSFFNNYVRAQAPANAKKLIKQLCGRGLLDTARDPWNVSSSI